MSEIQRNIIHLSKKGPISKPPFITGESNVISSSQSDDRKDINCHNKFDFLKSFLIMEIEDNTTVIFHYSSNKIPLHVHMMITDIEEGEKNCTITHSYTLFIIFHNRIVKINLENIESGCVFRNCIIDNSFMILSNLFKTSIKSFFKEISKTRLISCIVQNQTCYIKEIVLVDDDDEHLFYTGVQFSFELPSSFTFIDYNDQHWYGNCIGIDGKLDGMENPLQINIYYDGKTNTFDDLEPIYLLDEDQRCILATSGQLNRFQGIGFEIVARIYIRPYDEDEDRPEVPDFIQNFLKLNKYHRCRWDSDCGSDSD